MRRHRDRAARAQRQRPGHPHLRRGRWPGARGLNGAGISITANYLESDRDFQQLGVPLSLIRRKVLEQEHFALAIKAVSTTPKSCSNNIMLGMAAGFGVDYECTTDEAFPIYPARTT